MKINRQLACAVTAVLGASASPVWAAAADSNGGIEEIVVTAQRRSENIQNVPITIQAMTADTLTQLNATTIDDITKYLPNVSSANLGPGQGNLYMRGLSVGALGTQGQGSIGNWPNVAVYLDDQATQLPGRNLDVYAADMERVEVLEGPQGTLFGAGAEAGAVRYITNKPKLDKTEASFNAGYGTTAHGDPNSNLEGVLNLPVIDGKLAVRAVVYNESRGGYINNVVSDFTRHCYNSGHWCTNVVPTNSVPTNNDNIAGDAINPVKYEGIRVSALYKINDEWDALVSQSYQSLNAQGVFYQMPVGSAEQTLPPLSVTLFSPSFDKDKFENTAVTINGKIGDLKAVYSGAYLVRNVEQAQDYTNYANGTYGYYYQCVGYNKSDASKGQCYSPVGSWHDTERNTVQSHEIRLSTPDDWRLRGLFGLYYQAVNVYDDTAWYYKTVPNCSPTLASNCYHPTQPFPGQPVNNPASFGNPNLGFSDNFTRNFKQSAAFLSVDYDLIPKVLTATLGTRYYHMTNARLGGAPGSFYCKVFSTPTTNFGPCDASKEYGATGYAQTGNVSQTENGFKSRANITWRPMDQVLLYATWSQGFRPGGFNRSQAIEPAGNKSYQSPIAYTSDTLVNKEIGWKTELMDRRLQFNGAIYKEEWSNVQLGLFAPQLGLGNLTFGVNGPAFEVKGLELQVVARLMQGLTVTGSGSWNNSSQVNAPTLNGNVPGSQYYNQPVPLVDSNGVAHSPWGAIGSNLANSPPFQANLRARYDWDLSSSTHAFWQLAGSHTSHSYTATGTINGYELPAWTSYDGSIGIARDSWNMELFGQNLTNISPSLFTSAAQFIRTETIARPRVLGVRFGYKF
jgi:iron complex outermembrane recepter protein